MYCPKCGLKNNDSASFCIKCGSKIILEDADASGDSILKDNSVELNYKNIETTNIKNQANENYNYKFDTKKDSYEKIGENYESTLRAYIGKNSDYYINQFKNIEENNKANVNWTWLVGNFWLLYRKMFAYFFLTLIPIVNIYFVINLIFNSNKIYYKFICKKIEKDGMNNKDIKNYEDNIPLAKKHGGISYVGIIISLTISIAIPIILVNSIISYISSLKSNNLLYSNFPNDEYDEMSFNISYNGLSMAEILSSDMDFIVKWLGEPSFDGYIAGGHTYGYNDEIYFTFDENTNLVSAIISSTKVLSVKGQPLNKNREELTRILGIAPSEGWSEDGMDEDHYYMCYSFKYCNLTFRLPSSNEDAYQVYID